MNKFLDAKRKIEIVADDFDADFGTWGMRSNGCTNGTITSVSTTSSAAHVAVVRPSLTVANARRDDVCKRVPECPRPRPAHSLFADVLGISPPAFYGPPHIICNAYLAGVRFPREEIPAADQQITAMDLSSSAASSCSAEAPCNLSIHNRSILTVSFQGSLPSWYLSL